MRIRNSVLVAVLSMGLPATLTSEPVFAQAAQPTAQELYQSGMELYNAGKLKEAQATLRKVDPLQLPRELQPTFYNALFEIDQKLSGPATPEQPQPEQPQPEQPQPEAAPDAASLLRQADALAVENPAEAIATYQLVLSSDTATDDQKATAQARIAGLERQMGAQGKVTEARKLITLAEQDIVNGDLDAAERKLNSVKNSGLELGFFDAEAMNKQLAVIKEVRDARAAAAAVQDPPKPQPDQPAAGADPAELAAAIERARIAEAQLAAMQRQLAEAQQNPVNQGPPVSDLMVTARVQTAAEKVKQGDQALRNGQLSAAVQLYEDATLLVPDNQEYADKLAAAKAELNAQLRPIKLIDDDAASIAIIRQRTIAKYEAAMKQAMDALKDKDYEAANDAVIQARTELTTNRGVFDTNEYNERTSRAASLQNQITETQRRDDAIAAKEQEEIRKAEEERKRREVAIKTAREVEARLNAARALQQEGKYQQALDEINAALFLDPGDARLIFLRDIVRDSSLAVESDRLMRERDYQMANLRIMNIEASTPYTDILTYPGEWPEITAMRLRGLDSNNGESEANRTAQAALRNLISLDNDSFSLDQVIDHIRQSTGANIAVNWPALELVNIDQDSLVSVSLANVPAEQLLRLVLDQVSADNFDDDKAGFTFSEGVIKISTLRDLKTETETRVYDIRDLLVQVPNFNNAPGFDLNDALSNTSSGGSSGGSTSGGGGGSGSGSGLFGGQDGQTVQEDIPSRDELVEQITDLITRTVGSEDEWLDEESTLTELNGNMIIKSTSDNHRQILGLLGRLRETRAVQISIEARFLTVDNNFAEQFLVDFDITFNSSNVDLIGGGEDGDQPDGIPDNGKKHLPLSFNQNSADTVRRPSTGVITSPFEAASSALGVSYGFLSDVDVNLLIEATQESNKSVTLTAPRLTFFNGQRAFVLVANQIAFVSDLEPVPDTLGFDPTISVISVGTVLDVEATISSDRRYVTMTLRPSIARLINLAEFNVGGGGVVDTGNPGGDPLVEIGGAIQVPEIEITQIRNTVSVPDRGTLLIGGQRLVGEVNVESGVPILSKIPIINRLFTNSAMAQDERTLMILVKPTIIIQSEQEEILFPGLNANPDQFNVGQHSPF